jgi:3-hydroxy-9,10-secoandrosta-1,3,5(10)-triene-9,17-dione monooxygenase
MSSTTSVAGSPLSARPSLVDRAKELGPALRGRCVETNELRRLPDATWNELIRTGIVRALQPARWGGGEVDCQEFYGAVSEVARAEGCAGWVAGVVGVHPWQIALYPKEAQEEVWGEDPTTMNSSSYAPTGKAERVPGGFRLNGRWSFSSGCDHCRWVNLGAITGMLEAEGRQLPDFRSFLLPRKDYQIDDNWHVAGLAGSGSKDIVVDGAFVPGYRSQSHWDYVFSRPLPGWDYNPGPLYRLPFGPVFFRVLTAAVVGAARGFLDAWLELSRTRLSFGSKINEDPFMQKLAAEASYMLKTLVQRDLADCEEMMSISRAGEVFTLEQRAELRYSAVQSARLASRTVERLFEASGGHAIFIDHPLQRRYQDIKAMMGHVALNPNPTAKIYGSACLGGSPILDYLL